MSCPGEYGYATHPAAPKCQHFGGVPYPPVCATGDGKIANNDFNRYWVAVVAMTTVPTTRGKSNEGIAYYKNLNLGHDIELPLRKPPIRFGVMRWNGQSSNSWRVWGDGKGNFYISTRDHMRESKISLHDSERNIWRPLPNRGIPCQMAAAS